MIYRIRKTSKELKGTIRLTPSKSISNRILIIRALCPERFAIKNLATAHDTKILENLLNSQDGILDAEDAGTTFRFLAAFMAQKPGHWLLTGTERMKQRPISILVDALRETGAEISYAKKENYPPLKIAGKELNGGEVEMDGSVSSQFISALLMIAPNLTNGLRIKIKGEIFSRPYIEMTLKLMKSFGIHYEWKNDSISVSRQQYQPHSIIVESDWSAASYWFEMAALSESADLDIVGLQKDSIQGDAVIADIMKKFGVMTEFKGDGIHITKNKSSTVPVKFNDDFRECPDLVQTMAVTCAALGIESSFSGIQNLRIKETDRLDALQSELKKIVVSAAVPGNDTVKFSVPGLEFDKAADVLFQTHNDHRMAMALAPLALRLNEIKIENPGVVNKSYPEFWNDLRSVGFEIDEIQN